MLTRATSHSESREGAPLEWSALLVAALAISTSPASYNFVLLLLPVTVLLGEFESHRPWLTLLATLLFLGIGYPGWNTATADGLRAVLREPHLLLLIGFAALCDWTLAKANTSPPLFCRENRFWLVLLGLLVTASATSGLRRQKGLYDDYAYRMSMQADALFSAAPAQGHGGTEVISLLPQGYRHQLIANSHVNNSSSFGLPLAYNQLTQSEDQLSFASNEGVTWIEDAASTSRLVAVAGSAATIPDARSPAPLYGSSGVAFIRDRAGRGQLFFHFQKTSVAQPWMVTPEWMNVEEASFAKQDTTFVATLKDDGASQIIRIEPHAEPMPLNLGEARYPAASPDGRWLAYSRFQTGAWNLWLLDRATNRSQRITDAACDQIEPAWESDSKHLLYASDCGRALGFTAICRRQVVL